MSTPMGWVLKVLPIVISWYPAYMIDHTICFRSHFLLPFLFIPYFSTSPFHDPHCKVTTQLETAMYIELVTTSETKALWFTVLAMTFGLGSYASLWKRHLSPSILQHPCGICLLCLNLGAACGFSTIFSVSVATNVTARDASVISTIKAWVARKIHSQCSWKH